MALQLHLSLFLFAALVHTTFAQGSEMCPLHVFQHAAAQCGNLMALISPRELGPRKNLDPGNGL